MTIIEREEKYLLMLRRATLGFARLLLFLAILAFVAAGGMYVYAFYVSSQEFHLPARANLLRQVDPCPYLLNTQAETNGRDSEGFIPVKGILKACNSSDVKSPSFAETEEAFDAFATDMVSMQKALGWSYKSEPDAKLALRKRVEQIQEKVLSPVENSQDHQKLEIATVIAAYSARLRAVANPSAAWVAERQEEQPSLEQAEADQPPVDRSRPKIARPTIDHLTDTRFLQNQLYVTVKEAKAEYHKEQAKAAGLKVTGVTALYSAFSFLGTFLALMLTFVFIKIEIDLRDIRDNLKAGTPNTIDSTTNGLKPVSDHLLG